MLNYISGFHLQLKANHQQIFIQKTNNSELCSLLWQSDVDEHSVSYLKSCMITIFKNINWIMWFPMIRLSDLCGSQKGDPFDPDMQIDLTQFQCW